MLVTGRCHDCSAFYPFWRGRRCQSNVQEGKIEQLLCLPENSLFPIRRERLILAPVLPGRKKPGAIFSILNLFILIILKRVLFYEC